MFENRKKLKAHKAKIKQLEERCVELRISRDEARHDLTSANDQRFIAIDQRNKAQSTEKEAWKDRDKFKKLVREQTEADLLINALKAVGMIKDEKPCNYMEEGRRLMAQQQMANTGGMGYGSSFSYLGGLSGAGGVQNILANCGYISPPSQYR